MTCLTAATICGPCARSGVFDDHQGVAVARQPCPDARGAIISLAGQGRAALERAAPPHGASVRRHIIDLLTPGELAALDTISAKVITHLADRKPSELPPR